VTFTEQDGKTNVRLQQVPLDASDEETACFAEMMQGMGKGWGSGYAIIDELLQELQSDAN
jgi:hypothetical protein